MMAILERGKTSYFSSGENHNLCVGIITVNLYFVHYSCIESKAICKSRSFSANITVSSAYNNMNNVKNAKFSLLREG